MIKKLITRSIGLYLNLLAVISPRKAGRKGFYLFCRPLRRKVKPHHFEFLDTAEKFDLRYDGKRVQGYRWGKGAKKILLLHGWESHSYFWKRIVGSFSKEHYTMVGVDGPGHGLSEGSYLNLPHYSGLIEALIQAEGGFDAAIGHSLGAFSAVYTLHRAPKLPVSKLVVMASPGEAKEFVDFYQKTLGLSKRTMKVVNDSFVEVLGKGADYFSLKEFAKTLELPGLLIHDTEDRGAPHHHAEAAHRNWKNSRLISTTGLGHNLKSDHLIEEVRAFLESGR